MCEEIFHLWNRTRISPLKLKEHIGFMMFLEEGAETDTHILRTRNSS